MNIFTERLRALPKAELHVHLEGTVTAGLLSLLAERNGVQLTTPVILPNSPPIYPPAGTASGKPILNSFLDFIGLYVKISECLRQSADVVLICEEYAKQAQAENIVQAEIYFSPTTFQALGRELDPLCRGLKEGEELALTRYGVQFVWIFDIY